MLLCIPYRRSNLLHITCICPIVVNKPCVYDFPIVLQVMSIVLQVVTSPAIRLGESVTKPKTSEVLSQIHNLLDITCIRFSNRIAGDVFTCNTIDITCNTIGKSYTHGLLTTIGQIQVICNRLTQQDQRTGRC